MTAMEGFRLEDGRVMPMVPANPHCRVRNQMHLEEGHVVIEWPLWLSQESFEDIERWLELTLLGMKRRIGKYGPVVHPAAAQDGR